MARENLNGSDALNAAYQKANSNFIELYAGLENQNELSEMNDVNIPNPQPGDFLQYDGINNKWTNSVIRITELDDVDIVSIPPTQYQVIQYDAADSRWVNSALFIYENNDVTITSPTNFQVLSWNGTKWINRDVEDLNITLDNLQGVAITSPALDHILTFNGFTWVNIKEPWTEQIDDLKKTIKKNAILSFMGGV
jgi:hypothetical protein